MKVELLKAGFSGAEADFLIAAQKLMRRWHERVCNGMWQNDDGDWYEMIDQRTNQLRHVPDTYSPIVDAVTSIVDSHGMTAYTNHDPRGCALYVLPPDAPPDNYVRYGIACVE